MKEFQLEGLRYLVRYPKDFSEQNSYPVIFYFHGAGSRGHDINLVTDNASFFMEIEKREDFPCIVVAPHCTEDTWFDAWERIKALVVNVTALPYVDKKRIYLTGASMGGYATWQLAMSMPEYFAAIAPICGGGMYWNAARLKNIPVWAFHGAKDDVVLVEESMKMVDRVNDCGGNAKLTIYPENGHDAWSDTYSDPKLFDWFLQHKKGDN